MTGRGRLSCIACRHAHSSRALEVKPFRNGSGPAEGVDAVPAEYLLIAGFRMVPLDPLTEVPGDGRPGVVVVRVDHDVLRGRVAGIAGVEDVGPGGQRGFHFFGHLDGGPVGDLCHGRVLSPYVATDGVGLRLPQVADRGPEAKTEPEDEDENR